MDTRRGVLTTMAGLGAVGLAGCSLLSGTIERAADPAGVADEQRESAGFEHKRTQELPFETTVEVSGASRDLRLTNYLVDYGKNVGEAGPQGASFVLFTTPSVTVAGEEANPFAKFDDRKLLKEVVSRANQNAADVQEVGTRTANVLDSTTQFRVYEATTTVEEQEVQIRIHFGRTSHDDDLLGVLGVHPRILDESENIYALVEGTEHPFEFEN